MLFADGFDHYTGVLQKWPDRTNSLSCKASAARNGAYGLSGEWLQGYAQKNFTISTAVVAGFAVRWASGNPTNTFAFMFLQDGATAQIELRVDAANHLIVSRNGTTLGTTTNTVPRNIWTYIELKVLIDPAVGTVDLRVNGVSWLALTAQNTRNSANSQVSALILGFDSAPNDAGTVFHFDDVYLLNTLGTVNKDFLGDVYVGTSVPNANGTQNNMARGGTDLGANWQQVKEVPPDDDSTYMVSQSVNDQERYTFPNVVPSTGQPYAIQVMVRVKKDSAGTRTIREMCKSGAASPVDSGVDQPLSQSWQYLGGLYETDPNTGVAWTLAAAQAAEFGVKIVG